MKNIAILGFGREGQALLRYLKSRPKWRRAVFTVLDKNFLLPTKKTEKNVLYRLGNNYLENLSDFDIVFRSPGVPYTLPELATARKHGVEISSGTKLFFSEVKGDKRQATSKKPIIIGITGTKGKGTVCTLLYQMLKADKKRVVLAGNIGKPILAELEAIKRAQYVIMEMSSFQLQDLNTSPDVAVVLDITPDHLDAHKNVREYYNAKASITKFQNPSDKTFYFTGNKISEKIAKMSTGKIIPIKPERFRLFTQSDLKILGHHNFKNAVVAATVAESLGCPSPVVRRSAVSFSGNPHRLEFVREVNKISFYNDSASTIPEAAAAAIQAFTYPTVLVAGGKEKVPDYTVLAKAIKNSFVKSVILFGENRKKLEKIIRSKNPKLDIKVSEADFYGTVVNAYTHAKQMVNHYQIPAIVVFSPASASFDMFRDYADRGEQFKKIVRNLK